MTDEQKKTPEGKRALRVTSLMLAEPHIEPALLGKISAPTLVLGSDHDLIKLEHLAAIYNAIPNANLAIFPNSTHMVPYDNPALFNATAQRFLDTPFKKIDRIPDTMASLEKMQARLAK
jgi:pimeloyl-ACP methyl ester carboxylesterase